MTHGRPLAYYSDRHSIFKTTRADKVDGLFKDTQVHRALKELKVELICAYSPQAKGRVERSNQTLQDRLIKELRLRGISTIEEAHAYLPKFIQAYNKKFSVKPNSTQDAHRPVHQSREGLNRILSEHHTRKLSKALEFSFEGALYQVQRPGGGYRHRHAHVKIYRHTTGELEVLFKEEVLKIVELKKYSNSTIKTYVQAFEKFINHYKEHEINDLNENHTAGTMLQFSASLPNYVLPKRLS